MLFINMKRFHVCCLCLLLLVIFCACSVFVHDNFNKTDYTFENLVDVEETTQIRKWFNEAEACVKMRGPTKYILKKADKIIKPNLRTPIGTHTWFSRSKTSVIVVRSDYFDTPYIWRHEFIHAILTYRGILPTEENDEHHDLSEMNCQWNTTK